MSDFSALLTDIDSVLADEEETLAKASAPDADDAADEAKIQAAADGDADDDGEKDGEDVPDDYDDEEEEDEGPDSDDDEPLTKSFDVTLPDGTEAQAIDGDALIKSFQGQIQDMRLEHQQAMTQIATALSRSTKLIKAMREQNQALASQVTALGQSGRGRKAVVSIHEKPMVGDHSLAKAEGISTSDLMAKALSAQKAGRLTGVQVAEIDAYVARGIPVPQSLIARLGD